MYFTMLCIHKKVVFITRKCHSILNDIHAVLDPIQFHFLLRAAAIPFINSEIFAASSTRFAASMLLVLLVLMLALVVFVPLV